MSVINLPDDSFPGQTSERIVFRDYIAPAGAFKGRGVLQRHAISLVISGEKTMHFAERTVHARDTEFHFLSAGNCVVSMNISATTPFRSILIFFDQKTLSDFFEKYATQAKGIGQHKKETPEPYLSFKKDAFVTNFINSLSLLIQSTGQPSIEMRLLKFEELMLYMLEKYPSQFLSFRAGTQATDNRHPGDRVIRKAVETNIANNINVEELAFLCNMSLSTFKRRFIKLYGMPPTEWFLQQRMRLAKELLHHEKPSEVYYKVGYESHSSFSQAFRKTWGKSPKEFRATDSPKEFQSTGLND